MSTLLRYSAFLIVSVLLFAGFGCTQKKLDDGKIPITTSSKEARELYLRARDLQDKFLIQESRRVLEQAVALDPDFALAYRDLAFAQPSAKGFFEKFNKARELVDKVSEGERLWILANEAGINGDPVKQEEYFRQLVEKYPKGERAYNALGVFFFGQQKYNKAIVEFRKATELAPDFSPPYNMLGYANRTLENYGEAEAAFQKYIKLNPVDPNPYDSYAELLLKMGRFEESIKTYNKALMVKPDFVPSHGGIAANLTYEGKYDEAREQLKKFYDIAKDDGQRRTALFITAMTYIDEGKYKEALAAIKEQHALAENINDTAAMAGDLGIMANILYEQGRYDDALERYRTSLRLIMDSELSSEIKANAKRFFLYNDARITMKKGDLKAAETKCEAHLEQTTEAENLNQIRLSHELTGMLALEQKNYAKALEEFQQGNQQNPYNLYRIALAFQGQKNDQKAEKYFKKAAEFHSLLNMNYAFARTKAEKMIGGK